MQGSIEGGSCSTGAPAYTDTGHWLQWHSKQDILIKSPQTGNYKALVPFKVVYSDAIASLKIGAILNKPIIMYISDIFV